MSPEQARGKPLDKRTDIWAFGCVLYEMLAGRAAYDGETLSDTLAAILEREPDWQRLPAKTPGKVQELLRRCLQKDAQHRLRDIGDARFQIEDALTEPTAPPTAVAPAPVRKNRERLLWLAGLVGVAAAVAASTRYLTTPIVERDEVRLEVTTPPTSDLTAFAISPNGKMLVFQATSEGKSSLWLRSLDAVTARPLAGTDGASQPFWSPDSLSVGFTGADGELKRIDLGSGTVQRLTWRGAGGAWNRDGTILFMTGGSNPILAVSATGGEATPATQITPETTPQVGPQFLPDGRHFLFTAMGTARAVYVSLLGGSEPPQRIVDGISGMYGSGHLLFVREGTLFAQPFDPVRLKLEGAPTIVATQLATRNTLGSFAFSVSAAGPIAYRAGPTGAQSQFAWYDRSGSPLEALAGSGIASLLNSALSPDGRQLAISRQVGGGQADIWLLDLDRGLPTRFTVDPAYDLTPVWSPDGHRIAFVSTRLGTASVYVKSASGTESEELIWEHGPPSDWSPDGRFILVAREYGPGNPDDIWAVPIGGDRKAFPVVESKMFNESGGQFSPDGRWIAFQSDESGQFEIYVQPFPGPGRKRQISSEGGVQARWRRDGAELFHIASDNRLVAVPVRLDSKGGAVDIGAPVSLFTPNLPMLPTVAHARHYMVSPDGQKFLVHTLKEVTMPITVILNWQPSP